MKLCKVEDVLHHAGKTQKQNKTKKSCGFNNLTWIGYLTITWDAGTLAIGSVLTISTELMAWNRYLKYCKETGQEVSLQATRV